MSTHEPYDRPDDDPQLRELLRSLDRDAAPVDAAALGAIRSVAGDAFEAANAAHDLLRNNAAPVRKAPGPEAAETEDAGPRPLNAHTPTRHDSGRRPKMLATRIAAVCLAGLAAVAAWLGGWFGPGAGEAVAFGEVLRTLEAAATWRLELVQGDESSEIWVRQPGEIRWQESAVRYRIARGSRLWRIDEESNQVTSENSPVFTRAGESVDVFRLLGLDDVDRTAIMGARPAGIEEYEGRRCHVYRLIVRGEGERVDVAGYADVETRRLLGLVVGVRGDQPRGSRPPGRKRPHLELKLIAMNEPVDESLFVVAKSLTEDGRIGKVLEAQGLVSLKPVMNRRWTPVARQVLLRPGDWVRTDVRGANAALAALSAPVQVTVGPASLVEFISPREARLHHGELQLDVTGKLEQPFTLLGPGDARVEVSGEGKQVFRVARDQSLAAVEQPPPWLQGFSGATNNESLGSLIVNIDGRNEPLTVGYHHVSVEVRDQIARTTIEESFVNHTAGRLEGTFHFPLPQDASISGFGMWIGDELVEADVVEKQRAREIYETILREKRDPGLLEWTGGNIFKARVFPIEAYSEKRIKIVYTQVLPLRGNRYRFSYGLNSELLKTKPLRELSIDVLVNSALPLKSVDCPTHSVRSDLTAHSAHVEFTAQEYTPDRDFEVVFELDRRQSDVVVIPHRRGDDGYFLIQLMPPSPEGNFQREVLPDGRPLDLVLLCDTSASMDSTKRRQQTEFVAALLSALGDQDRFRIAACDVGTTWAFAEPTAATDETRARAAAFLDERLSLGWTDLDQAFAALQEKLGEHTQVIYVGDGIVSTGDADPAAFVNRLKRMLSPTREHSAFHAVTVGNSYESVALKGIAALGGGSMRAISGEQTPPVVALELLNELAQPGLRNTNLEFRGLQVAAVYPESLPNVPAGMQQIIVGRYLPTGKDQRGEVVVSGTLNGEPVRYAAQVALADAEEGNSFIPRLWARAHLDQLLAQGQNPFIRDEIIALSEEFHIITPYTSLLVLETDADRERFGVKRRYEMRDGERFFAEGRDNATYELIQQQMRRAGDWRIGLRRRVLAQLGRLGRNPDVFQQQMLHPYAEAASLARLAVLSDSMDLPMSGPMSVNGPWGGVGGYMGRSSGMVDELSRSGGGGGGWFDELEDLNGSRALGDRFDTRLAEDMPPDGTELEKALGPASVGGDVDLAEQMFAGEPGERSESDAFGIGYPEEALALASKPGRPWGGGGARPSLRKKSLDFEWMDGGDKSFLRRAQLDLGGFRARSRVYQQYPNYLQWVDRLFPALPGPQRARTAKDLPVADWPADVRAVTDLLHTAPALHEINGGLALHTTTESRDPRWNRVTGRSEALDLFSPQAWLSRPDGVGPERITHWCDGEQRGVFSTTFGGGRVRAAVASDLATHNVGVNHYGQQPLHETHHYTTAELISQNDGVAVILFMYKNSSPPQGFRLMIDVAKRLVVKAETLNDGKVTGTTTYGDLVEVHGLWWPTKIVTTDAAGEAISTTTQAVTALAVDEFRRRLDGEFAARAQVLFVELPFVDVDTAKQKVADGSAGFNEHLAVLLHFTLSQQWDEVRARLASIEQLHAGMPLLTWLRAAVWQNTRMNEDVRQLLLAEARRLVDNARPDEWALVEHIRGSASAIMDVNEQGALLELLRPVYERQPATLGGSLTWQQHWFSVLQGLVRNDEALALLREMAEATPWDVNRQTQYAQQLAAQGDHAAAYAWLDALLAREVRFEAWEHQTVYQTYDQLLRNQGRFDRLIQVIGDWIKAQPSDNGYDPYARYLSAIVFNDEIERAEGLVREWVAAARVPGKLPADMQARLDAAVWYMLGQGYNLYWHRVDVKWLSLLKETVSFHARQRESFAPAQTIMGQSGFRDSDECDALLREVLAIVKAEAAQRDPHQLQQIVSWLLSGQIEIAVGDWQAVVAPLRERWQNERDEDRRHALSEVLVSVFASRFADTEYLPFLRLRTNEWPVRFRGQYLQALFDALLQRAWSQEIEDEAFALLPRLQEPLNPRSHEPIAPDDFERQQSLVAQVLVQLGGLHRAVDRMIEARYQAALTAFQDTGHPEELTRRELAAKQAEFRKEAREGVANTLSKSRAIWLWVDDPRPEGAPKTVIFRTLTDWALVELVYLDMSLNRNLEDVAASCWQILGDQPPQLAEAPGRKDRPTPELATPVEWTQSLLDGMRRRRALVTVMNLACRRSAKPELVDKLLAYLDAGIAQGGDDAVPWKQAKYSFLVGLDRPDALTVELRKWIAADEFTAPWRVTLGRLLAERGELKEAIQLLEAVQQKDELAPGEHRLLSDWYQAVDRRADYERARIAVLKVGEEWQLQRLLYGAVQRWQNPQGPRGNYVEDETLFVLRALLEKSSSPGNYLWQLRELYRASRDFRVLEALPAAMVGRTPQEVYSFLQHLRYVLEEVRKEATSDEIVARIARDRDEAKSAIDLRALDLLEAMVERRASEVLNQPGPHVAAALAAMRRAFEREWADGERRQMAAWLAGLGVISQQQLRGEQVRELRALAADSDSATDDGLWITWHLCQALFNYGDFDEALPRMQTAVRDYEQAHTEGLPAHANEPLSGYVSFLEQRQRYSTAETLLRRHLQAPLNDGQRFWLAERLDGLYLHALQHDGQVSLGSRESLYKNLVQHILEECATPDDSHRANLIYRLLSVYRTAADKKYATAKDDLRQFAFDTLPELLSAQSNQYPNIVQNVGQTLHDVISPRMGLRFLVRAIETYPRRYESTWQNAWNQFGHYVGAWLHEDQHPPQGNPAPLGDLEAPLLKIVLTELRRDLVQREQRQRQIYHMGYSYYWGAHEADYLRIAEEVYQERKHSGRSVKYIADYVWHGLGNHNRPIEMLFVALRDDLLNDEGRQQLVTYLFHANRHAEAVPILEPLVARHPDAITYRVQLVEAYFRSQRPAQMRELLAATDEHFRQQGRWTEGNVAALGEVCVKCELWAEAVKYYGEVIPLHQRTQPNQGIGGTTLSYYYQRLATAHSQLQHTAEAVDAAASAIVSWGPVHHQRDDALRTLDTVLGAAPDLDQYVASLDAKAAETGQDSPILRKAIGKVYRGRANFAEAARNLELALELAPGDAGVYPELIECYQQLQRKDDVTRLRLAQIDLERHNLDLYVQLAAHLKDDPQQAERAATSIVEAAPNEAENHQALAKLREDQSRWPDAIAHWRRVADLRVLEPGGLLGLAAAEIRAGELPAAHETLDKVRKTEWPSRFDDELRNREAELQRMLQEASR